MKIHEGLKQHSGKHHKTFQIYIITQHQVILNLQQKLKFYWYISEELRTFLIFMHKKLVRTCHSCI